MTKKFLLIGGIVILFMGVAIVAVLFLLPYNSTQPTSVDNTGSTQTGIQEVVNANNKFAFDLYSEFNKTKKGNIFYSPYSISAALAMTYEGAKGQTANEMKSVFHFPENNVLRPSFSAIYSDINKSAKNYELRTGNALWAQKDYSFLEDYISRVEKYYGGKATNLDFAGESEKSRQIINNWVEDQTNNKIKDLIPAGTLDEMTRLVLTNAIYFKGIWVKQFNEDETRDRDFRISSNNNVKVKMMQRTDDESIFGYTENNQLQILEMPYSGEKLSMLVFLPKDDDIESLENSITTEKLSEWKEDLKEQKVNIFIPKFKFETKYFMADTLAEMGMPTAFGGAADFSGMTGKMNLAISQVIHQAFVEVSEEGTEAAAATAVGMPIGVADSKKEPKISVFRADHPFIFLIQQKSTGNVLFMGRVVDPTK